MRSVIAWAALAVALALAAPFSAAADESANGDAESLLAEAIRAYTDALGREQRGSRLAAFRRAEQLFSAVIARGAHSPELYTNLGNAALQGEDIGAAVLAYRRALRLDPDEPRALQNLEHARGLLPDWVPRPEPAGLLDSVFFWQRSLARADRVLAAAVTFAAAALLLAAWIRFGRTALRSAAIAPALLWLLLLGSIAFDASDAERESAVLTPDETLARAADSPIAPNAFPDPLPGGTEVRILEDRSPWLRVRLANGRDAWVPESAAARVALER